MSILKNTILCFAVAGVPLQPLAQQKTRPDPADAGAPVPATSYDSVFHNYVSDREPKAAGWKEVNDEVGLIGGHVGHIRGATGGAGRTAAPGGKPVGELTPADQPAASGHAGHPK